MNTPEDLKDTYRVGYNVGIRLGEPSEVAEGLFLYALDVDVKGSAADADEAYEALGQILPGWKAFPYVKSGRGGDSAHIYFASEGKSGSKKLAHSAKKVEWTDGAGKTHKSWAWEIELFGTGKQVAAPPSIHPDTAKAYEWGREIDFDDLDAITEDVHEIIGAAPDDERDEDKRSSTRDDSSRSLSDIAKSRPLGLSFDEAWDYLLDLPKDEWCFDYEGWLKVGMAIHHEFNGSADGLDLWHDFSKRADNYEADVLDEKWKGFGKDKRRRPVRFATLINAGAMNRFKREVTGAEDDDPLDDEDDSWLGKLVLNDKGEPKSTSDNIALIIANDVRFRGVFAMNRFVEDICVVCEPAHKLAKSEKRQGNFRQLDSYLWKLTPTEKREGKPIEDGHLQEMRILIESPVRRGGYGVKVSDRDLMAAVVNCANKIPFHPVQNYLNELQWDGKERLDYVFVDYLGCPDDEYHRQTARLFFLAAVTRAYQHGHKFDYVPILEGLQGIRKSTFVRILGRHWYVELDCAFDDPKKIVETLVGQWIAEIPELSQFNRSEVATIKAFFSKGEEKVREAYGRKAKRFLRQSVYMGTTNDREYLRDPTGNRRFWPIQCRVDSINTDKLERNINQIWAEARELYRRLASEYPAGKLPLYLTGDAKATALELQESRRVETAADGLAGMIQAWANERVPQSVIEGKSSDFERHDGRPDPLVRREKICGVQVWCEVIKGTKEAYAARANTLRVIEAIRLTGEWEEAGREYIPVYGRQRVFRRLPKAKKSIDDLLG